MEEKYSLPQRAVAEVIGTALLVLVGPGSVVATLVLAGKSTPAISGADLLGISFAFGLIITAVVYASVAVLVASLASRRALAAAAIVGTFLVTAPVVGVLSIVGGSLRELAPVLNPVTLVGGVKRYLFHTKVGLDLGIYGPMYVAVALALVIFCTTLLLARYRKAGA